jgi:hypothetical protein
MHRQAMTKQVENLLSWREGLAEATAEDDQLFAGSARRVQKGRFLEAWSIDALPALAWLLDLGHSPPRLVCGPDVEVFEDGFFEGCWAGDFSARDFDTARHVFGSGARQVGEGWLVVSPSHTMEAIYLLSQQAGPLVSNSLAFLCAWAEIELPFDRGIVARLFTASDGVGHYVRELFEGPGWSIRRACFDNLAIGPDGVRYLAKPGVEARFTDFSAYETYLLAALALVVANGADPLRRFRYELSSTCSSGYDSTACTALAAKLGARRAFTIRGARGGGSDSGRPVIERLGLEVIEVDRPRRPKGPSFPEAEFIGTGMSGAEFSLFPLGPHLRHTILFSGFFGGDLWGLEGPVSRTGRQDDTSGGSMAEFRLRCGFVHLPVPWIGFESLPELRRLCHSEAMKAWRTGTGYERPIARRLAEENGVPRGSFGTKKRATAFPFHYAPFWWSEAALAELRELERQRLGAWRGWLPYQLDKLVRTCAFTTFFAMRKLCKLVRLEKRLDDLRARLVPSFHRWEWTHPRYGSLAFLWGQSRIRSRYPRACDLEHHLHRSDRSRRCSAPDDERLGGGWRAHSPADPPLAPRHRTGRRWQRLLRSGSG